MTLGNTAFVSPPRCLESRLIEDSLILTQDLLSSEVTPKN